MLPSRKKRKKRKHTHTQNANQIYGNNKFDGYLAYKTRTCFIKIPCWIGVFLASLLYILIGSIKINFIMASLKKSYFFWYIRLLLVLLLFVSSCVTNVTELTNWGKRKKQQQHINKNWMTYDYPLNSTHTHTHRTTVRRPNDRKSEKCTRGWDGLWLAHVNFMWSCCVHTLSSWFQWIISFLIDHHTG